MNTEKITESRLLKNEEDIIKRDILDEVEKYLYDDVHYTDLEIARKIFKVVGERYDI